MPTTFYLSPRDKIRQTGAVIESIGRGEWFIMLRILITGGAGFIGLHLAKRMLAEGHNVIICDNFSRAVKDPDLQKLFDHKNCQIVEVDLLDVNSVHSLGTEFDLIFHLAAIIGVQHVLAQPYAVLINNVKILENVISLAKTSKEFDQTFVCVNKRNLCGYSTAI